MFSRTLRVRFLRSIWLMMIALMMLAGTSIAQDDGLTAVCMVAFEAPPHVEWLTDAQIADINALEQDPAEAPVPEIVGLPDPATGSCATEDGVLKEYSPQVFTPICLPSGPEGDGPLVVQWALTHYLPGYQDVILADPETGACPVDAPSEPVPGENGAVPESEDTGDDGDGASADDSTSATDDADAASDDSSETTALPRTGSGASTEPSERAIMTTLVFAAASLFGAAIVTLRSRAS